MSTISTEELVVAITAAVTDLYWVGVPDTRLAPLLRYIGKASTVNVAPREDLAVAAAFGASLAGRNTCIYMKDAGLGHCLDAILTTFRLADIPTILVVSTSSSQLPDGPGHHKVWAAAVTRILAAVEIPFILVTRMDVHEITDFIIQSRQAQVIHALVLS